MFISAQSPGPWRHSAGAETMLSQSLRARAAGKGHRAPISQMWKLRPRGGIREVSVSDAPLAAATQRPEAQGGLEGAFCLPPSTPAESRGHFTDRWGFKGLREAIVSPVFVQMCVRFRAQDWGWV